MALNMLIVEDDMGLRPALEEFFGRRDFDVTGTGTVADSVRVLEELSVAVVLLDIQLPDGSGLEVLRRAIDIDPETAVIMMTAFPEIKTAVKSMQEGAMDFVVKPYDVAELKLAVNRALELRSLRRSVQRLDHEKRSRGESSEILGESPAIQRLRGEIAKVAEADSPVLITGPTGTGKELVADAIHSGSRRSGSPLVKVNCSAFSEHLLESELFGHEKGAFTDAKEARAGFFEMADGGTLFLDEISEMKPGLQAKLLRVVEGQPFRRVGGNREIRTDVRVLAATNRRLEESVKRGEFREDLYFRLNVFQLRVPPLEERGEDVILLAQFFLDRSVRALRKARLTLSPESKELLQAYHWPGNVRELRNVMERAAILCEEPEVTPASLPHELQSTGFVKQRARTGAGDLPSLADIERQYIDHVTRLVDGNISEASRILGISRNTLKAKRTAGDESRR